MVPLPARVSLTDGIDVLTRAFRPPSNRHPALLVPQTDPSLGTSPLNPIFMLGGAPTAHDFLPVKWPLVLAPAKPGKGIFKIFSFRTQVLELSPWVGRVWRPGLPRGKRITFSKSSSAVARWSAVRIAAALPWLTSWRRNTHFIFALGSALMERSNSRRTEGVWSVEPSSTTITSIRSRSWDSARIFRRSRLAYTRCCSL